MSSRLYGSDKLLKKIVVDVTFMQPILCCKLAESSVDFLSILPLVQALVPGYECPHWFLDCIYKL